MDRLVLTVKKLLPLLILTLFLGCATVHQPIGMDSNKTNKFSIGELNKYRTDDSKTKFYFQLSFEQALDIITSTFFDLDIPIYYPLKDDSQQIIKIKSGNFIAKLGGELVWGSGSAGVTSHYHFAKQITPMVQFRYRVYWDFLR